MKNIDQDVYMGQYKLERRRVMGPTALKTKNRQEIIESIGLAVLEAIEFSGKKSQKLIYIDGLRNIIDWMNKPQDDYFGLNAIQFMEQDKKNIQTVMDNLQETLSGEAMGS